MECGYTIQIEDPAERLVCTRERGHTEEAHFQRATGFDTHGTEFRKTGDDLFEIRRVTHTWITRNEE